MSKDRFRALAVLLRNELGQYELRPSQFEPEEAEADGWWTPVAKWARNRPPIGLFFDRILGRDGERHFWFGFYSTELRIQKLSDKVSQTHEPWALITDDDVENESFTQQALAQVRQRHGLVLEQYRNEHHYFGKYDIGFTFTSDDQLAKEAASFLGGIVKHIQPELDAEAADIDEIKSRINETKRKQLIDARRGQGQFRSDLLRLWRGCAVTGCTVREVLRASHIKPWSLSSDPERLNVNNGLLLIATLDALFDRGLVSFGDNGEMIISPGLCEDQVSILLRPEQRSLRNKISCAQKRFLAYHRKECFRNS